MKDYVQSQNSEFTEAPPFFSFKLTGRYGRLNFINSSGILMLLLSPVLILLIMRPELIRLPNTSLVIGLLVFVIVVPLGIRYIVLRLHDFNVSGWFASPIILLPYIGSSVNNNLFNLIISLVYLIAISVLLIIPGTKGVNNYGAPVPQGSYAGLIAIPPAIFILVILLTILVSSYLFFFYAFLLFFSSQFGGG